MTWRQLLLSGEGRLNRARFWLAHAIGYLCFLIASIPYALSSSADQEVTTPQMIVAVGACAFIIVGLWILFVSMCKRFHDRDKSGVWILINLVPYIGGLWFFIECGCLAGTRGRNRYGADPLRPDEAISSVFA